MQVPSLKFLPVGDPAAVGGAARRLAYWDWPSLNDQAKHTVVCVHGLSRQGRDFDTLAQSLQPTSRVVAVDVAGRGHSDWLADPMAYQVPTYVADLAALILALRAESPGITMDWVGTSMGGLIGLAIAAQPALAPRRLVLNDVGPVIQWAALQRIGTYLGKNPQFESEQAACDYLASISTGFGPHTAAQWHALCVPMLRHQEGKWRLHYDPAIAQPLLALLNSSDEEAALRSVKEGENALWRLYDAITSETLLLRGAESDLLSHETALLMSRRGPMAECIEFAGVGHAPTLIADEQVNAVRRFLLKPSRVSSR
ncbi:pimeloyl-ACP methyl ester carboxylesterase [Hydrogenophaga palleronii]|uniref:Pimeloyl-ACP methyl ester carboxylesterase n=1 Tax=Hydrogenophaga palleronii TaxID=65655 RepID=A0ABU1WHG9_9BURK|nr:alpha/beta hydrolase [Hydrogenophaga palleronii]MDR7148714.1 pimeloyl-ACP methyl ester carboxylesterase [Hydrogenophaga palleronii]